MSEKFKNKYRIDTTRLRYWDYSWNAPYFVTVCTHNRQHFFGKITAGRMELSKIGEFVQQEWLKTPEIRPDMNLRLGEFVVMPNHFHAVLLIGENEYNTYTVGKPNEFGPQSKNLASIMRGFKSAVTIQARELNADFAWQSRYHDHVIRDNQAYHRISNYIINNPSNWNEDTFYLE